MVRILHLSYDYANNLSRINYPNDLGLTKEDLSMIFTPGAAIMILSDKVEAGSQHWEP